MNKEERVKLVFETISKIVGFEIKPGKEFYMVANGEKNIYLIDEFLDLRCKTPEGYFRPSGYSISPIFKGGYQFEEIKEPLLTEEEKDFLRQFKFKEVVITDINLIFAKKGVYDKAISLNIINFSFDGLEKDKRYFRKELGV